jgi:hypothetical protein
MTAAPDSARHPLLAGSSPLMFGVQSYATLLRRQWETTLELTTAWTAAMSAASSTLIGPPADTVPTARPDRGAEARRLWAVPTESGSATGRPAAATPAAELHFGQPTGRMLGWLTTTPTLHPDLFDEAMVLLVDEDIKTAS